MLFLLLNRQIVYSPLIDKNFLLKGKMRRVCVVVFSYFPDDPRVKRETDALVQEKMQVVVLCLCHKNEKREEYVHGARIIRMNLQRKRHSKFRYLFEYFAFISWATIKTIRLSFTRKFNLMHIHNMPDLLVISSVWPRIFGAKVILDLHDPMPEVFMSKYNIDRSHVAIRFLELLERFSIRCSDIVLTPNIAFRKLFIARDCPPEKIFIIMNSPQNETFESARASVAEDFNLKDRRFKLMYHGTIVERHGLDLALESIAILREKIPMISFHVFGSGDCFVKKFLSLIKELMLEDIVVYHGFVPLKRIAQIIKFIDVGIIPNRLTPFTDINLPTRIFEYLYQKKPVIAPKTQGILDYFDDDSLFLFRPGCVDSLTETITKVYEDVTNLKRVVEQGYGVYCRHCWDIQKSNFIRLIDRI
ncbi:MAG: glycosyltransferase family 4 protein [Candidatus Zhuqueibacterota bacterium]